jgi:hypothetical protein
LYAAAQRGAGDKLRWHEGIYPYEGAHRDMIFQLAPDADVIYVVDADEIYPDNFFPPPQREGQWFDYSQMQRYVRVPMIHYWRSFYRAVLHDPAWPVRIIYPKAPEGEFAAGNLPSLNHMGYAQRPEIVEFKQHTHGHKGEWRKDVDWFNDVFMANRQTDCHPVGSEYWNPETVNPWDYLPEFMKQHPFAGMDVIR